MESRKRITAFTGTIGLFTIVVIVFSTPVFAERHLNFEKVIDINKNELEKSLTNLENLPKIFPATIKSVKPYSDKSAQIVFGIGAFFVPSDVELTKGTDQNIVKITSGDLKDTHLVITTQETWGFDGMANQGTLVNIDMVLQTSGFLALAGLASDDNIRYSFDKSILDLVSYVKNPPKESVKGSDSPQVNKRQFRN
ncbi:MAG: hypothetical protein ACRD94_04480 [Nitrosopumilaceae archaeon]